MERELFWLQGDQRIHPILRGRRSADAVVVGGGLSGVTIALWLCKAGLKVVLLEAETLGCGATSRCAGMLSLFGGMSYARMEQQYGMETAAACGLTAQNAFQALRDMAREQGAASDWQDTDAYVVSGEQEPLQREAEAMRKAGIAAELGKATLSPLPAEHALCLRNMATLHPMKHLRHLVKQAESQGLSIYEHSRVTALETNLAYTARGSVLAPYVIVATGYPVVNIPGWYFMRLIQKQGSLIPLKAHAPFDGMYRDLEGRYALRRLKGGMLFQLNGPRVGLGIHQEPLDRFEQDYASYFEQVKPDRYYTGIETYSADGLPYIGVYSKKTPNLFVAAGYGGHGLLGSMVAAQAISARVLGLSVDGYGIYSGQRRNGATFMDEVKTAAGIGGQYMKNMLRLNAPRCPHLGCKLKYRTKERLWECPCHGSRFDDIGHVINAPSIRDAVIRHRRRG